MVWMAQQSHPVQRTVALKIIKAGMDTKQVLSRFEAERQALAAMQHPNIASFLDAGATESGRPYVVMELVKGIPITEFCRARKLDVNARLELFRAVCAAVNHAHQKGIIHRDLKPSNVLVTLIDDQPVPKVIDFGIAKATHSKLTEQTLWTRFEQFMGTPAYMSPEQAAMSGVDVDTRADIYSLGILLYELLAGTPPFDAKTLISAGVDEMRRIIREEEPPKPSTRLSEARPQKLTSGVSIAAADAPRRSRLDRDEGDREGSHAALRNGERLGRGHWPAPWERAGHCRTSLHARYRLRKFARRHPVLLLSLLVFYLPIPLALLASFRAASVEITKDVHNNLNLVADLQLDRVREALEQGFRASGTNHRARRPLRESLVRYLEDSVEDSRPPVQCNPARCRADRAISMKEISILSHEGLVL